MDFYLTNLVTGVRLHLPITPDKLNVKMGASVVSMSVIRLGEVKIPRGTTLTGYSWNCTFPGRSKRAMSFVRDWQEPERIVALIEDWIKNNHTLRLMVTETSINTDVFIESFPHEYYGVDDISYTLSLTKHRDLIVTTIPSTASAPTETYTNTNGTQKLNTNGTVKLPNTSANLNVRKNRSTGSDIIGKLKHGTVIKIIAKNGNWYTTPYASGTNGEAYLYASYVVLDTQATSITSNQSSSSQSSSSIASSVATSSYKVKSGDTLYSISKAMLSDGARWMEIYALNQVAIDKANAGKTVSRYSIYTGTSLKLPEKSTNINSSSVFAKTVASVLSNVSTAAKSIVTNMPSSVLVNAVKSAVKTETSAALKATGLVDKLK